MWQPHWTCRHIYKRIMIVVALSFTKQFVLSKTDKFLLILVYLSFESICDSWSSWCTGSWILKIVKEKHLKKRLVEHLQHDLISNDTLACNSLSLHFGYLYLFDLSESQILSDVFNCQKMPRCISLSRFSLLNGKQESTNISNTLDGAVDSVNDTGTREIYYKQFFYN